MQFNPKTPSLLETLNSVDTVALDLETTSLNPRTGKVLAIALSFLQDARIITNVLDTSKYSRDEIRTLLKCLSSKLIIAHHAKFDTAYILGNYGIKIPNVFCTMLASQIINNGKKLSASLIDSLKYFCDINLTSSSKKEIMRLSFTQHVYGDTLSNDQLEYAGNDTKHLLTLHSILVKRLTKDKLSKAMHIDNNLIPVLAGMEVRGCRIDVKGWKLAIARWEKHQEDVIQRLDAIIRGLSEKYTKLRGGKYTRKRKTESSVQTSLFGNNSKIKNQNSGNINYRSSTQLLDIFDRLDLTPPTDKHGKKSTGENALNTYLTEYPEAVFIHPFVITLLELRKYDKLISTYGESFLEKLEGGYIHTDHTQCFTETGRLSSKSPNLQNIPRGELRAFFIPAKGKSFITCDMDSAEVRVAGDYSGELKIRQSVEKGRDLHSYLATTSFSTIFGKPVTINNSYNTIKVDNYTYTLNDLRTVHKQVLFAFFYGAKSPRIYQVLAEYINNHHSAENRMRVASDILKGLENNLPTLAKYLKGVVNLANKDGYLVMSKTGRRRYFLAKGAGDASNAPIQSTNAEAIKIAMIRLEKYLTEYNTKHGTTGVQVMNIHDEVVIEIEDAHAESIKKDVESIMADSLGFFLRMLKGSATANVQKYWEK